MIEITNVKRNTFKHIIKRLDFEELKKITGDFELSTTRITFELLKSLKIKNTKLFQEIQILVQEMLKYWILICYKLSKNSSNSKKIIKSSMVLRCLEISMNYQLIQKRFTDVRYFYNLNTLAKMSYKVFINVLSFSIIAAVI